MIVRKFCYCLISSVFFFDMSVFGSDAAQQLNPQYKAYLNGIVEERKDLKSLLEKDPTARRLVNNPKIVEYFSSIDGFFNCFVNVEYFRESLDLAGDDSINNADCIKDLVKNAEYHFDNIHNNGVYNDGYEQVHIENIKLKKSVITEKGRNEVFIGNVVKTNDEIHQEKVATGICGNCFNPS